MSTKRLIIWILLIGLVTIGGWYLAYYKPRIHNVEPISSIDDFGSYINIANLTYVVDGIEVKLVDGVASTTANGLNYVTTLDESMTLFSDVSGDGVKDNVVVISHGVSGKKMGVFVGAVLGAKEGDPKVTNMVSLGTDVVVRSISYVQAKKRMTITVFGAGKEQRLRFEIIDGKFVDSIGEIKG